MTGIFVDSSAWYALLDRHDPQHARVAAAIQAHRGRLVTSDYILDEAVTLVRYHLGWPLAHRLGAGLRSGDLARLVRVPRLPGDGCGTRGYVMFPFAMWHQTSDRWCAAGGAGMALAAAVRPAQFPHPSGRLRSDWLRIHIWRGQNRSTSRCALTSHMR